MVTPKMLTDNQPDTLYARGLPHHRMTDNRPTPQSSLFERQWHLDRPRRGHGGVDARSAWQYTTGSPEVVVAVIDVGFDLSHEVFSGQEKVLKVLDLHENSHFEDRDLWHGTASAALAIASQVEPDGLSGVAPRCRFMPISIPSPLTIASLIRAFEHATDGGAAIISCGMKVGHCLFEMTAELDAAIRYATTRGRRELGCLVLWSGGNDATDLSKNAVARDARVITVGASTDLDLPASYSNFGPGLDLLAPSSGGTRKITTAAPTGRGQASVHESRNYVSNFGGTSASVAIAAGVGALLLSARPTLSAEHATRLLLDSASKLSATTDISSKAARRTMYNERNDVCGFGRVDAREAIRMALSGHPLCDVHA